MRLFADSDLPAMNAWYAARGLPGVRRELLPASGFLEPGVAVGFLYRTDSGLALVHHVVTNPAAPARARHRAVRAIVGLCEALARELGHEGVLTWTSSPSIARVAQRAGAVDLGSVILLAKALAHA